MVGNEPAGTNDLKTVRPTRGETDPSEALLRQLWDAANAGDETAYRSALATMALRLRGYFARRLPRAPDQIEDLVQETLLAIHLHRGTHVAQAPIGAWMHAIARHKLVDYLRRHRRSGALNDPIDDVAESQLTAIQPETHAARDIAQLIDRLPAAEQRALVMIKLEGLPAAEAARQAGVSVTAIRVRAHRALKRLAAMIRSDDAH